MFVENFSKINVSCPNPNQGPCNHVTFRQICSGEPASLKVHMHKSCVVSFNCFFCIILSLINTYNNISYIYEIFSYLP
jgi:hypothetical protein